MPKNYPNSASQPAGIHLVNGSFEKRKTKKLLNVVLGTPFLSYQLTSEVLENSARKLYGAL